MVDNPKTLLDRFRVYDGKYPHVWIECKSITQAEEIKQQILRNQEIVERVKQQLKIEQEHIIFTGGYKGNTCKSACEILEQILDG